ncbi:hypothetical protein ACJX0J_033035, partial [Zea mays]
PTPTCLGLKGFSTAFYTYFKTGTPETAQFNWSKNILLRLLLSGRDNYEFSHAHAPILVFLHLTIFFLTFDNIYSQLISFGNGKIFGARRGDPYHLGLSITLNFFNITFLFALFYTSSSEAYIGIISFRMNHLERDLANLVQQSFSLGVFGTALGNHPLHQQVMT